MSHESKVFDFDKVVKATEMFLEGVGEDLTRDGIKETPKRAAKFWQTVLDGYDEDPAKHLKVFESDAEDMVFVEAPIYSFCEHHLALFQGTISIAYIPNGKVIGLSKLVRIARVFAKRLQIQERLIRQIADFLEKNLSPLGVAVYIKAEHSCMTIRGVRAPSHTKTTRLTGLFKEDPKAREEFMSYLSK